MWGQWNDPWFEYRVLGFRFNTQSLSLSITCCINGSHIIPNHCFLAGTASVYCLLINKLAFLGQFFFWENAELPPSGSEHWPVGSTDYPKLRFKGHPSCCLDFSSRHQYVAEKSEFHIFLDYNSQNSRVIWTLPKMAEEYWGLQCTLELRTVVVFLTCTHITHIHPCCGCDLLAPCMVLGRAEFFFGGVWIIGHHARSEENGNCSSIRPRYFVPVRWLDIGKCFLKSNQCLLLHITLPKT